MANQLQQGQAGSVIPPGMEREDRMLIIYMRDLCLKRNWGEAAKALSEAAGLDPTNEAPISSTRGFLWEWWIVFWKTHSAATEPRGTDSPQTGAQSPPGVQSQTTQPSSASKYGTHSQVSAPPCNPTASPHCDSSRIPESTGTGTLPRPSAPISSGLPTYLPALNHIGGSQHGTGSLDLGKRRTPPVQHSSSGKRTCTFPPYAAPAPWGMPQSWQPIIAPGSQPLLQQPGDYDTLVQLSQTQGAIDPSLIISDEPFDINPEFGINSGVWPFSMPHASGGGH